LLDCACFIDPTAFAVHPQFTALAIDGKGFTTFVAVNKFIHTVSLLLHTKIAQSKVLAVFAFRGRCSLLCKFFLLSDVFGARLTLLL